MSHLDRNRTVVFEGGLGSQLLSLIEALRLREESVNFEVDVSYFFPERPPTHMIQRPWRLDRYGFEISQISKLTSRKRRRGLLLKRTSGTDWDFARKIGAEIPISAKELNTLVTSLNLDLSSEYSVVHLRRGDYLNVSSRVISDDEVAAVLIKSQRMLDDHVIVISDSKITLTKNREFREFRKSTEKQFHFLEGTDIDECVVHDLMRNSNFLICSNSTFSFTAALLSKEGASAIAPIEFFDPETMSEVNKKFRAAGNFFLLN